MLKAHAAIGLFGLSLVASPAAGAGPSRAASLPGKPEAAVSDVHTVAGRCGWKGGERYCGRVRVLRRETRPEQPIYYYAMPPGPPEVYPTGSREWWQAMDRDRRGGFRR